MSKSVLTKIKRLMPHLDHEELKAVSLHCGTCSERLRARANDEAWKLICAAENKDVLITGKTRDRGEVVRIYHVIRRGKNQRAGYSLYSRRDSHVIYKTNAVAFGIVILPDSPLRREAVISRWRETSGVAP